MPSRHSLVIRLERYEKIDEYIGAMEDVVIFLCIIDTECEGEARPEDERGEDARILVRLVIATDESPESLTNRPFLPLSFALLVKLLLSRWWRLGLLRELREGSPRVLAREMKDPFATR